MSLISQNALPKNRVDKVKKQEIKEPVFVEGNEETEVIEEPNSAGKKSKKRKKEKSDDAKQLDIEEEKEMKKLENFLFGSLYSPVVFGKEDEEEVGDLSDGGLDGGPTLFFTDRSANEVVSAYEEVELQKENNGEMTGKKERKPVWIDEEEEKMTVDLLKVNGKLRKKDDERFISGSEYVSRLRAMHAKLNPGTEWAQRRAGSSYYSPDDDSDEESGVVIARDHKNIEDTDDILQSNEDLVQKNGSRLLPGLLEYSRLVDANATDPSNGPINSVQFHRNAELFLAAGLDRRLRFFQIDGKRNTKIQSIFLEDCPIHRAAFLPDGSQVIVAGRRNFFYSVDLVKASIDRIGPLIGREEKSLEVFEISPDSRTIAFTGNEGHILLVSAKTKELCGTLKMNGTVRALAFADDGRQLLSFGGDGHVYHWDLRKRTCLHKGVDEGCVYGSALGTSPNGSLFAAGSESGIVNLYNREEFLGNKRKPIKTIENLTTRVDCLKFNTDAQIMAICSTMQKNSLKLVHIPSYTVFSNWPPQNRTLHHPRCIDFSPGGGYMAMGNAAGKVFLYKLHHYQHA